MIQKMLKKSVLKRAISAVLSFAVVFSVAFVNMGDFSIKADAARDTLLKPSNSNISNYYYIKNVRSGKYLTLENNSTADGTRIVQWHFNAGNNQKWRFEYFGNTGSYGGEYQIVPYNATNKAIQMVSATSDNGVEARLAAKGSITRQFFRIEPNYTGSRRFVTNGSNFTKVLEINGAAVSDGVKLIQFAHVGNGSDQWLFEPVNYDADVGGYYAEKQHKFRIMTYPNFNNLSEYYDDKLTYEECNFVSQCLCAAGNHYRTSSNYWFCNKNNFYQPTSFTMNDLNTNWEIRTSWYIPKYFYQSWVCFPHQHQNYTYNDVITDNYSANDVKPIKGSIIIVSLIDGSDLIRKDTYYVKDSLTSNSSAVVAYHKSTQGNYDYLENVIKDNYKQIQNDITITIVNI